MKTRSAAPIAKVSAGGIAGSIVVIIVWLLAAYAHVTVPGEVASALTLLIAVIVGYLTPLQPGEVWADELMPPRPIENLALTAGEVWADELMPPRPIENLALTAAEPLRDDAALGQARAATASAEAAHSRIDELARQIAERLADAAGAGQG